MNIIIVDDEEIMLQIIKKTINWEKSGIHNVFTAKNSYEAKKIIQENVIDISLCDIEMPQESGLSLIEWIQGLYPEIINIILTGHADFNYARNAISLGVYRFLLKPISFKEIEKTIQKAMEKIESEILLSENNSIKSSRKQLTVVDKVKEYLERHYNEVITRSDIESVVHLNRDYLNREFKREIGYTLMEYVQYYRIRMAKKMLRETEDTIFEICIKIGYDSPAYFSKIFKKKTGITPTEYRLDYNRNICTEKRQ